MPAPRKNPPMGSRCGHFTLSAGACGAGSQGNSRPTAICPGVIRYDAISDFPCLLCRRHPLHSGRRERRIPRGGGAARQRPRAYHTGKNFFTGFNKFILHCYKSNNEEIFHCYKSNNEEIFHCYILTLHMCNVQQ